MLCVPGKPSSICRPRSVGSTAASKVCHSTAATVAGVATMAAKDTAAAARVADVTATATTSMASMGHPPQGQGVLRLVPQCLVKLSHGLIGDRVGDGTRVAHCMIALASIASPRASALHRPSMLHLLCPPSIQRLRLTHQTLLQLLLFLRLGLRGVAAHALAGALAAPAIGVLHLTEHTESPLVRHRCGRCSCGSAQLRAEAVRAARGGRRREEGQATQLRTEHRG